MEMVCNILGAILLKSKLSLDELEDYYSVYQKNEWSIYG